MQTVRNLLGGTTKIGYTCDLGLIVEKSDLRYDTPIGTTVNVYRNGRGEVTTQGKVIWHDNIEDYRGANLTVGVSIIWVEGCSNGNEADRGSTYYIRVGN